MATDTRVNYATTAQVGIIVGGGLFGVAIVGTQYILSIMSLRALRYTDIGTIALLVWSATLFVAGTVAGMRTGRVAAGVLAG